MALTRSALVACLICRVPPVVAHRSHGGHYTANEEFSALQSVSVEKTRWIRVGGEEIVYEGVYTNISGFGDWSFGFVDTTDYTGEVREYMGRHPNGVPGNLPRATEMDAAVTWASILAEFGVDDVELLTQNETDFIRQLFMDRMFYKQAGILYGANYPGSFLAQMSQSGLAAILEDLPMKMYAYSYPGWYYKLEPLVDSFAKVLQRTDAYLQKEGTRRLMFINEPYIRQPWAQEQLDGFGRVLPFLLPFWPPYAMKPEARHGILLVDPEGSAHGFHFHDAVWNTQVVGRKAWFLMYGNMNSKKFFAPIVGDHTEATPNACAYLLSKQLPPNAVSFTQHPGETILLPGGVWHTTCALDSYTSGFGGWMKFQKTNAALGRGFDS